MEEAAASSAVSVVSDGSTDPDSQREIDLLDGASRQRQYGIVLNSTGDSAARAAVEDALSASVPVVIALNEIPLSPQPHLSFVLENSRAGAELVGERLRLRKPHGGYLEFLGFDNYSASSVKRLESTGAVLHAKCPNLRLGDPAVMPSSSGYVQLAAEHALDLHPDLVAFVALNARAGLGAVAALESRHLTGKVTVIVYDQSMPLLLRLRRGSVDAIVVQNMRALGARAVRNILDDRAGRSYDHKTRLAPVLVTRENIDTEATQDWLLFNLEKP